MAAPALAEPQILNVLERRLRSKDFKLLQWNVKSCTGDDEEKLGFAGDHFFLETEVETSGKQKTCRFFVKLKPAGNDVLAKLTEKSGMFVKEVSFFENLAEKFTSILSKVRPMVPDSQVSIIPTCYFTSDSMIILENLKESGFQAMRPDAPFPLEAFSIVMRVLARFHAASLALEERLGKSLVEEFGQNPELFTETFLNGSPDHSFAPWHAASLKAVVALLPLVDKYKDNPELVKKAQDAMPGLVEDLWRGVGAWPNARNILCHGDLWINNLLLRLDSSGKPIEGLLVDFQMLRYAPPAIDIVTFLFFLSDKDFRDKHFDTLVRDYYSELRRILLDLDVQADKVLPWEELVRTLREAHIYGLTLMTLEYPLILAPSNLLDSLMADGEQYKRHLFYHRTPFCIKIFNEHEPFRVRFTEVVEELIDNYIAKM